MCQGRGVRLPAEVRVHAGLSALPGVADGAQGDTVSTIPSSARTWCDKSVEFGPAQSGFHILLFSLWPKGSRESQLWAPHLENRAGAISSVKWEEEADRGDIGWVLTMYTEGN